MAHELDDVRMGGNPHWAPEDVVGKISLGTLLFSNDYRHIALKGILTSLIMLGVGGIFAIIFRTELMVPDVQLLGARVYMTLMTLHGMFMVFGSTELRRNPHFNPHLLSSCQVISGHLATIVRSGICEPFPPVILQVTDASLFVDFA